MIASTDFLTARRERFFGGGAFTAVMDDTTG